MSNEEFKKNIKTISNNDLLEQVEFMSDGYYFELVEVCLEELRCRLEASRWHYPSKGEYPPRNSKYDDLNYSVNVLTFTDESVFEPSVVAYYIPEADLWRDCVHEEPLEAKVLAWQYIIPPKEEA